VLTILNDPAGITGGTKHRLDYSISLQDNIARHMASGGGCELLINGIQVDPLTDRRLDIPPGPSDLVTVVRRPEGWETAYYIVMLALVVYTYANMPNVPDDSIGKDSPNNKLTAQTNIARAYQAIPDAYGYRRLWPDLIQPSTVEYIDQVKYVTEWLCVSRGRGTITDVRYAESPLEDIAGSSFEIFEPEETSDYPEFSTTTLNDVNEAFASDEVNGQEMVTPVFGTPWTELGATVSVTNGSADFTVTVPDGPLYDDLKSLAPNGQAEVAFILSGPFGLDELCQVLGYSVVGPDVTFTFRGPTVWGSSSAVEAADVTFTLLNVSSIGPFTLPVECSDIWWNTNFLRGLRGSVVIRATWWQIDGDGVEVPGTRESDDTTFFTDSLDQLFYTNKITPTAGVGRYRIQFERTSLPGVDGEFPAKLEEVFAVRNFPTKELTGVTVIRVTAQATLAATGFSDRKFNVRWLRHVRTLEDDELSGSRNFARIMAHIWTIAGNDISGLDVDALAAINDDLGETSPLLRFDGSLDDADVSLGERLQLVANTARCVVWRDGRKWTVTRDQARTVPEMQLDYRNLAKRGESVINYAAHLPASFDGVELTYVNEATQATKSYVRLNITTGTPVAGPSNNPKRINLTNCTTLEQAENRAHLEARKLIYQRTTVNDEALADASQLGVGALVRWIDPNDFGGDDGLQAGEVLAIAGNVITPSEPLDWKGETSGRILFTGTDGKHLGAPVVCTPVPGGVQLESVPAGLYVADADRQLGSRYAFAVGLTEAEVESAGLFVLTRGKPSANRTVSLALAEYDARFYDFD
jgi:hypothetical protein